MRHEPVGELHDAHRVGGYAVISDHTLADPEVPTALDSGDGKMALRRMPATLRLDPRAAAEALPRLRIIQDRVGSVDGRAQC